MLKILLLAYFALGVLVYIAVGNSTYHHEQVQEVRPGVASALLLEFIRLLVFVLGWLPLLLYGYGQILMVIAEDRRKASGKSD